MSSNPTPEQIFQTCPELRDIADRLEQSEVQTREQNEKNEALKQLKIKNPGGPGSLHYKQLYPEHFCITEIYRSGRWEKTAALKDFGRTAFENAIKKVVDARNPSALKIEVYAGKRNGTRTFANTCWLVEDAKIIEDKKEDAKGGLGLVAADQIENLVKQKLEELMKPGGDNTNSPEAMHFKLELLKMSHAQEMRNQKDDYERIIDKKDDQISDLEDEIAELEEELAEVDGELGNAATMLEQKIKPPTAQVILAGAIEAAAEAFVLNRPKILTDVFKLRPEQIKEIFETNQTKQLEENGGTSTNTASVSFDNNGATDEYAGFDPAHANAIKMLHTFIKSLSIEDFKKLYTICFFCAIDGGAFNTAHADKLIAQIPVIEQEENNGAQA